MAIKQVVPIFVQLQGDGSNTVFTFALQNLYQAGFNGSVPFGSAGVVPSSVVIPNPPVPVTSSTVDANGNITITLTGALGNGVQAVFELDLIYNSGAATSASPTQTQNVTIVGSSTVTVSGTIASNITQVGGASVALGQTTMANSFPVAIASNQTAFPVNAQASGTALTATGSSLNVNITGGSSGNAAASATGSAVPASADYLGVNVAGTLRGQTGVNPTGSVFAAQIDLSSVGGTSTSLGSKVSASSIPVVIASDQGTFPVTLTSTTITGTVAVTQSTTPWIVSGAAASGASKSGNPVQIGGVFNTTQPTVTTGQAVEVQATARGAQIVSTGVDTFNVTVNAALPAGTNVIGHVIIDSGSTTVVTGTVTVSGTVTSNIGTTGGITVAQASTTSGQSGPLIQGAVTTASPSYTTAQTSPLSLTLAGALRVDGSATTQPVSLTSTTITGTVAVTQSTTPWTVAGAAASGASKSGNPVQMGGVFNTTQPTVTTGQAVEVQSTARGAQIVATGVDTFNVTVNAALPAGTNVIGHVIMDSGSTTVVTGTVTVSGTVTANIGTTGGITVAQGSTTSGESGPLIQGAVTTGAPAYTTAQTSPLSMDLIGGLRTTISDRTTAISLTAAAQTAVVTFEGRAHAAFVITSVGTGGQFTPEASIDGATWVAVDVWNEVLETWATGTITTTGSWWFEPLGATAAVRIRCTAITSGTITGTLLANTAIPGTFEYQGSQGQAFPPNQIAVGGNVTTSAPTYVNSTFNALSLDTSGNLRVAGSFSSGALADLVGSPGTLNGANTTATINAFGYNSIGMFLAAGTLVGTIVPECSMDGGTTWTGTFFDDPATGNKVTSIVFGSANTVTTRSIVGVAGASNYRVRVSAFTSGTASCTLRANLVSDPSTVHAGQAGGTLPPTISQVGGSVTVAAPTYVTGTFNALSIDTNGSLRTELWNNGVAAVVQPASTIPRVGDPALTVSISPNSQLLQTFQTQGAATWTSATSLNTALTVTTTGYNSVLVTAVTPATLSGGGFILEGSPDGVNWFTLNVQEVDTYVTSSFVSFVANSNIAWVANVAGWVDVRVRLNPNITGAGNTLVTLQATTGVVPVSVIGQSSGQATGTISVSIDKINNVTAATDGGNPRGLRVIQSANSKISIWDTVNGVAGIRPGFNTGGANLGTQSNALVTQLSEQQTGLPLYIPNIIQKTSAVSTGSVASLTSPALAVGINGNTYVLVCGVGNGTIPTVTDSQGNTWKRVANVANGSAFNVSIFMAPITATIFSTFTVNNGGTAASIAMEVYEVQGILALAAGQPDFTATSTGTSATASTSNITPQTPNEFAFAAVGVGTAAQTITVGTGWTNDSGQLNPTTPAGLFSFVSMSQVLASVASATASATFTSEPWAMAVATFRQVTTGIQGTVKITDGTTTAGVIVATTALKTDASSVAGTALGTPTNFGTTPGAVVVGQVNASIFSGTTALGTPNTFGTTAPTGNALGVNASLFVGTTLARTNQTTTATGALDVNHVGIAGTTVVTAAAGVQKVGIVGNANATIDAAVGTLPTNNLAAILAPTTGAGAAVSATSLSVTTSQNVKASAGNIYGLYALNGAASTAFVQFVNSAGAGTLGTASLFSVPIPASTTQPVWVPLPHPVNASTGIAVGASTTNNGNTAVGTAVAITVFFK